MATVNGPTIFVLFMSPIFTKIFEIVWLPASFTICVVVVNLESTFIDDNFTFCKSKHSAKIFCKSNIFTGNFPNNFILHALKDSKLQYIKLNLSNYLNYFKKTYCKWHFWIVAHKARVTLQIIPVKINETLQCAVQNQYHANINYITPN